MHSPSPCSSSSDQPAGARLLPRASHGFVSLYSTRNSPRKPSWIHEIGRASSLPALSGLTGISILAAGSNNDRRRPFARHIAFGLPGKGVKKSTDSPGCTTSANASVEALPTSARTWLAVLSLLDQGDELSVERGLDHGERSCRQLPPRRLHGRARAADRGDGVTQ